MANHLSNLRRPRWLREWDRPTWLGDLDLDPETREQVHAEAVNLHLNDSTTGFLGGSRSQKNDRRGRIALGGRWRFGLAGFLSATPPIALMLSIPFGTDLTSSWSRVGLVIVCMAIGVLVLRSITSYWLIRPAWTPYYATALRRRGIVVCPKCGYPPSNQAGDRESPSTCPECGLEDPLVK
ncbi:MAG: hypothetical protein CMJ34_14400 [Phycisphaerae bacterium]|nr:hypothetical protein [Phycisphaerae bacterium]